MKNVIIFLTLIPCFVFISSARRTNLNNCIYVRNECPNEQISFWLYKNETRSLPKRLNPLKLPAELFLTKKPLRILIHGFIGDRDDSPNLEIRDPLLQTQAVYVISVDYESLAKFPCYYPWSVVNARVVGKCLAQLLDNLIEQCGYETGDLHIIGFSLGAQIAGLASNFVKHKIKRITALDPAFFGFTNTNAENKLDTSDADFIDVVHTDPFFFSTTDALGHADFYVNFPSPVQPGCNFWRNGRYYNCNHFRAPLYYAESIMSTSEFWAEKCGSWMEYLMQTCDNFRNASDVKMGYFVSKDASGSYFLTTNSKAPFAKGALH